MNAGYLIWGLVVEPWLQGRGRGWKKVSRFERTNLAAVELKLTSLFVLLARSYLACSSLQLSPSSLQLPSSNPNTNSTSDSAPLDFLLPSQD